jgi:hypothetical protein
MDKVKASILMRVPSLQSAPLAEVAQIRISHHWEMEKLMLPGLGLFTRGSRPPQLEGYAMRQRCRSAYAGRQPSVTQV